MKALTAPLSAAPRRLKPKAPRARKAAAKVWTGARKRVTLSPLQLSLPGIGAQPL